MERIVVIKIEVLQSESNPTHFQTSIHTYNEYTPEEWKRLFAKLNVVESTYYGMEQMVKEFKELTEE